MQMYTRISKANEEIPIEEFVSQKLKVIEREIKTLSTEYIMGVDKDQFINMLVAKYSIFFDVYYDTERLSSEGKFERLKHMIDNIITIYLLHILYTNFV